MKCRNQKWRPMKGNRTHAVQSAVQWKPARTRWNPSRAYQNTNKSITCERERERERERADSIRWWKKIDFKTKQKTKEKKKKKRNNCRRVPLRKPFPTTSMPLEKKETPRNPWKDLMKLNVNQTQNGSEKKGSQKTLENSIKKRKSSPLGWETSTNFK